MAELSLSKTTQALLQHPAIFRAGDVPRAGEGFVSTGFSALDAALGGGWPRARLIELMGDAVGVGEISLLLPLLPKKSAAKTEAKNAARALWIGPSTLPAGVPCVAYAAALARAGVDCERLIFVNTETALQTLWALEQALLSGAVRTVFAWLADAPRDFALRRIAQAARASEGSVCVLMRPARAHAQASPAPLRITLKPALAGALDLTIIKQPGLLQAKTLQLQPRALACLAADRVPVEIPQSNANAKASQTPLLDQLARTTPSSAAIRANAWPSDR